MNNGSGVFCGFVGDSGNKQLMEMRELTLNTEFSELPRLGNLFQIDIPKSRRWEITSLDRKGVDLLRKDLWKPPYRPIRLDPYWMGRLGFEEAGDFYELPDLRICRIRGLSTYEPERLRLHWVHQLQNLYRDLHGKELALAPEILQGNYFQKNNFKPLKIQNDDTES